MNAELDQLRDRYRKFGQDHVFAFWDNLQQQEREDLLQQLEAVDLEQLDGLVRGESHGDDWVALSRRAEPPKAVRLAERNAAGPNSLGITPEAARAEGIQALREGKVAVLITAGGQGSRLGFDKPKAMYPIGPVSKATLGQIHIEKVLAASEHYGAPVHLLLMTSPATHDDTLHYLEDNNRFGLPAEQLTVFCQGTMPAVDAETGKLLLASRDALFRSPDGHGGTLAGLDSSGALDRLIQAGVEHLFYLQVDNPLVPICDPELIGYHRLAKSELTSVAVAKQEPKDKLGNFAMVDDKMLVIEYSDFPDEVAELRDADGGLKFWAGSIAVHIFDTAFLDRARGEKDSLPIHIAHKKVPHIDAAGQAVKPSEPNALKFERFIFDLLPHAERPIVVEYGEADCFAPLKNASGAPKDTPEYVQELMTRQHRGWLAAAGVEVPDSATVEISPRFALDADLLAEKAGAIGNITGTTYLKP
ncbi:MAG: UDPGP type 1 family protein [Planctomycetota bacterium]